MPEALRTPDERFQGLRDWPYAPCYRQRPDGLRLHYVDIGPRNGRTWLCLHGQPTWSYLYRHMIPPLARAGRVIAPDLIGFGRSDKPAAANAYTYKSHVRWLRGFIQALDLDLITMVCQDWGGSLGLRVLSQIPERFARLVAMNTGIGDGGARSALALSGFSGGAQGVPSRARFHGIRPRTAQRRSRAMT